MCLSLSRPSWEQASPCRRANPTLHPPDDSLRVYNVLVAHSLLRVIPVQALTLTFEEDDEIRHIGLVHTIGGSSAAGGGPSVHANLRSGHAVLSGKAGATIQVLSAVPPPDSVRLVVCHVLCSMPGAIKVVFWARTPKLHPTPRVSIELYDVSDGWRSLTTSDDFRMTIEWVRYEMSTHLPIDRVGHRIEVSLGVARAAGVLEMDDLEVWAPRAADGSPPHIVPASTPVE